MQKISFWERCLPHPFVSVMVGASWLMLAHSLDFGNLLMALILALLLPYLVKPFIAHTPHIHYGRAIRLTGIVLWDIVIANLRVAKLVLGPSDQLHPKWFRVPLASEHDQVNSLLAMIITTTPGTVSAGIDQERGDILVHALSTQDTDLEIQEIKRRYETPLMHIFGVNPKSGDQS